MKTNIIFLVYRNSNEFSATKKIYFLNIEIEEEQVILLFLFISSNYLVFGNI